MSLCHLCASHTGGDGDSDGFHDNGQCMLGAGHVLAPCFGLSMYCFLEFPEQSFEISCYRCPHLTGEEVGTQGLRDLSKVKQLAGDEAEM